MYIFKIILCYLTLALSSSEAVTFDSLKVLIQEKQINSIESLLPFLPEKYLSKYVLMFKSRSLHDASFENPRVLMYGEDAKFIISFNGSNTQKGYFAIETMEFNDQSKEFYYREILFPERPNENSQVSFSESNPEKCLKCHGIPARPIWDTHPFWPGAYGERYLSPLSHQEEVGILKFLSNQPTNSRYKNLINTKIYADKNTFYPSAQIRYIGSQKEAPNEELSRYLSIYNAKRIAKTVFEHSEFTSFRYMLLASLSNDCENIESFIPVKYRNAFIDSYKKFSYLTDQKNKEQDHLKNIRSVSFNDLNYSYQKKEINSLNSFRFIVENFLGLSTVQWTTALEEETFDFSAPRLLNLEIEAELLNTLSRSDPMLQNLSSLRHVSSSEKYCTYLQKQSLLSMTTLPSDKNAVFQNLSESITNNTVPELIGSPTLLKRCINCHQGSVGPKIPFNQPKALALQLSKTGYPRGSLFNEIIFRLSSKAGNDRMPRGRNISEKEKEDLERYLRSLKENSELQKKL